MNDTADSKGTVVTGVIGEDVHIIGIRIVEHALRARGIQDCLPLGPRYLRSNS